MVHVAGWGVPDAWHAGRYKLGVGGALLVLSPWEGENIWQGISYCESPPQALEVCPPHHLPPLQHLAEAIFELLMYQAKGGGT